MDEINRPLPERSEGIAARNATQSSADEIVVFGPFRLHLGARTLHREGMEVALGSRAMALLLALVERAGQVLSVDDLLKAAWPGLTVTPNNVRAQMVSLRRALGETDSGSEYIQNLPARGYRFLLPSSSEVDEKTSPLWKSGLSAALPRPIPRMAGREADVSAVADKLRADRFVTIVGPGGVGKTTLATAVADSMMSELGGRVCFVDLSPVGDPTTLLSSLNLALGITEAKADSVVAQLGDAGRLLIVFDCCEHLVEGVAGLTERLFLETTSVRVLATSREALGARGEQVHNLSGLPYPPDGAPTDAEDFITFPAIRLFVERARANLGEFELTEAQAPVVAGICRRLDGLPLAIELAAGRLGTFGVEGVFEQLDSKFELSWTGRRTASARHRTLRDTIDWSFNFLEPQEQAILRQLSIVTGTFTLAAARAVTGSHSTLPDAIFSFVTKSLLKTVVNASGTSYRLLDTTRTYLREKLTAAGEEDLAAEKHARWYCAQLQFAADKAADALRTETLAGMGEYIDNVRSALEWSFATPGQQVLAVTLASLCAPVFVERSSYLECVTWCERALSMLTIETAGTYVEVEIKLCLGWSMMSTNGNSEEARDLFTKALALSEQIGRPDLSFRVIGVLHMLTQRMGEVQKALELAARAQMLAKEINEPVARNLADWLLGLSHHFAGDQIRAGEYCATARLPTPIANAVRNIHFGFDHRLRAVSTLARALFLQGYLDQSRNIIEQLLEEPEHEVNSASLCFPLIWTAPLFIEFGERERPERLLRRLHEIATRHSLRPYISVAAAWHGILRIGQGDIEVGAIELHDAIIRLEKDRYEVLNGRFYSSLAQAYGLLGQSTLGLVLIGNTIVRARDTDDILHLPDMYRIKGDLMASQPSGFDAAEDCYREAVELARNQGALFWELRAELARSRLMLQKGSSAQAVVRLAEVFSSFSEGFESRDLVAARMILDAHS